MWEWEEKGKSLETFKGIISPAQTKEELEDEGMKNRREGLQDWWIKFDMLDRL